MEDTEDSPNASPSAETSSQTQPLTTNNCSDCATCSGKCGCPTPQPALSSPKGGVRRVGSNLNVKRRGEAAEAAFLHKATLLGFSVAKPWGESDRYDFILENGARSWRVQVKSAFSNGKNGHTFHACGNLPGQFYTAEDIDFLIGYVVPEDVWYVFPIHVFAKIHVAKVFPSSKHRRSKFEKYREAWCLLACPLDGHSRKEVDVHLPCHGAAGNPGPKCPRAQ